MNESRKLLQERQEKAKEMERFVAGAEESLIDFNESAERSITTL